MLSWKNPPLQQRQQVGCVPATADTRWRCSVTFSTCANSWPVGLRPDRCPLRPRRRSKPAGTISCRHPPSSSSSSTISWFPAFPSSSSSRRRSILVHLTWHRRPPVRGRRRAGGLGGLGSAAGSEGRDAVKTVTTREFIRVETAAAAREATAAAAAVDVH